VAVVPALSRDAGTKGAGDLNERDAICNDLPIDWSGRDRNASRRDPRIRWCIAQSRASVWCALATERFLAGTDLEHGEGVVSASLPVPMLQLCGPRGSPHDAVRRLFFVGRWWFFATNGQAALLVAAPKRPGKLRDFPTASAERAFATSEASYSVAWHDLCGWLRERNSEREPCLECDDEMPARKSCDYCDGAGGYDPIDASLIGGVFLDRNLVARCLAPVYSPRVLLAEGSCEIGKQHPVMFRAADDSWRAYVAPVLRDDPTVPSWFPRGQLEAA
jgi:hypothetical protein